MSKKKLLINALANRTDLPESVDFDGTNDYLSRASDLVGNADGKTFTFSCWFYTPDSGTNYIYNSPVGTNRFSVAVQFDGQVFIQGRNPAGLQVLEIFNAIKLARNTLYHLLVSIDLTDTGKRHIYISDSSYSISENTYTNDDIDFTTPDKYVGSFDAIPSAPWEGRLAHVFLDYTYRDLSIEANRRLFTTIDPDKGLIPASVATQAALNPILYLPMTDPDTITINEGTGGDFTLNGVVARSSRGPNQYNAVASEFDGSADYLSGAISGLSDSKNLTLSFSFRLRATGNYFNPIFFSNAGQTSYIDPTYNNLAGGPLTLRVVSGGAFISNILINDVPAIIGKNYHISMSYSTQSQLSFNVLVDGVLSSNVTFSTFIVDAIIPYSTFINKRVAANLNSSPSTNCSIGELYFDTSYIDLATNNPFYDVGTNKPKYLGESGELPTGSQPLIYLPLRADDAGKNLGSGGDFTVNSGPFVGARSASEHWARSAKFDGSTGYLNRGNIGGGSSDECSIVFAINDTGSVSNVRVLTGAAASTIEYVEVGLDATNNNFDILMRDSTNADVFNKLAAANSSGWTILFIQYSKTSAALSKIVAVDGTETAPTTWKNTGVDFTLISGFALGANPVGGQYFNGDMGFVYLTNNFIDFTLEANRLKFVSGLGYPLPLDDAILDGSIPEPLIYMKFEDPSALGFNSGTGGDFTINGSIQSGADVDPG